MKINLNGKINDISAMLLSAERYALGRQTYMVQWTCEFIANNLHLINEGDRRVMIRDIKQQKDIGVEKPYGWDCDEKEWMNLLKILENSLGEENK